MSLTAIQNNSKPIRDLVVQVHGAHGNFLNNYHFILV